MVVYSVYPEPSQPPPFASQLQPHPVGEYRSKSSRCEFLLSIFPETAAGATGHLGFLPG